MEEKCEICEGRMEQKRGGKHPLYRCGACGTIFEVVLGLGRIDSGWETPELLVELVGILTGRAIMSLRVKEIIKKMEEKPP